MSCLVPPSPLLGITAVIADDHPLVLEALVDKLADAGIEILCCAADGAEAADMIESRCPNVALLDARMPRMNGIEVARRVRRTAPATGLVLFTGFAGPGRVADAFEAGFHAVVLKEAPTRDVVRAIATVSSGGTYLDPVFAGSFMAAQSGRSTSELSSGERDVVSLIADGLSNRQIAARLSISAETVRTHVRNAMSKLGTETRTEAVAAAIRHSLIA
jgi:DNA-binding NarL/FixJ family response regulator